jgi:hypothetical protein
VLDTHSWRKIGTIKTRTPFWSAVIGPNGKVLYAMAPQKHSIRVIDAEKMRQIRVLKVSGTPALALVAHALCYLQRLAKLIMHSSQNG